MVGLTGFFNLDYATSLEERKLRYPAYKLTLCHILSVAEGLRKYILYLW